MYRLLLLLVTLTLLTSCAMLSTDEGEVISRPFTTVDTDREIVLSKHRSFEIVLPSNPTTGYDWVLDISQLAVVASLGHRYIADAGGRVGVGGETIWLFRTRTTGTVLLTYSYQQSGDGKNIPTRVVTFKIVVR